MAQDMRSWINLLDEAGLLARIKKPVDPVVKWERCCGRREIARFLFENLPGFPGWRCLGQAPGDVSLAPLAFGTHRDEMVPEFVRRTERLGTTRMVKTGPVKEKVYSR